MTTHRCGMSDLDDGVAFSTRCAWPNPNLTFAFEDGTNDVGGSAELQAVRDAFATWAAAVPVTFTETAAVQNPDIAIDWRPANDPDRSMVGGVLAHADFPPSCGVVTNTLPKPVRFDDSEHQWVIGAVDGAVYVIREKSNGRLVDAHDTAANDFSVVTRTVQNNDTQRWLIDEV
jgi:hypothetical protein